MQILSITTNLSRYGGAQKVLLDVHTGLKQKGIDCKILGFQKFDTLHSKYTIGADEYVHFKRPWQLKNKILIVHARNVLPIMVLLKKVFFLNTKIIYVSHNVYSTHKTLTFFPKHIVSISKKVTQNLIEYFKQSPSKIRLIYNGVHDVYEGQQPVPFDYKKDGVIKILYPARVNSVKRQLLIIEKLKDTLPQNIEIHFAGVGDDYETLKNACVPLTNFKALGFIENMHALMVKYDYLMLHSVQEGLPIALLEGIMHGKPLLVNDVGGNLEIGVPGYNAVELNENWDTLLNQLTQLNSIPDAEYLKMSQNSRQLFLEKFRYETMIDNYCELINQVSKN